MLTDVRLATPGPAAAAGAERPELVARRGLGLALALGLGLRLVLAWLPAPLLAERVTADDAYYYLALARQLAAGAGPTLDGLTQTNGFHPLYALLLVPLAAAAGPDPALGVHLALTLVALAGVATAWPIYLIGRAVHSPAAGRLAAAIHLLNPWAIVLALIGVESSVYLLCLAWAVLAYRAWRAAPTWRQAAVAGALLGLAIMARSEAGLLLPAILLDVFVRRGNELPRRRRQFVLLTAAAGVVCLPWGLWSLYTFGTPVQLSSQAIMLHTWSAAPAGLVERSRWYVLQLAWFLPRFAYKLVLFGCPVFVLVGATWLAKPGPRWRLARRAAWSAAAPLSCLAVFALLTAGYYHLVLLHQQHWYFNALVLALTLLAAPVVTEWWHALAAGPRRRVALGSLAVLVPVALLSLAYVVGVGLYGGGAGFSQAYNQGVGWVAGRAIATRYPVPPVFASTDSGLITYACGCPVVNLDGVMNADAVAYYRRYGYSPATVDAYLADFLTRHGISQIGLIGADPARELPGLRLTAIDADPAGFTVYAVEAASR